MHGDGGPMPGRCRAECGCHDGADGARCASNEKGKMGGLVNPNDSLNCRESFQLQLRVAAQ
jgi:hypothetical protein